MKVRCLARELSEEQRVQLRTTNLIEYQLVVGRSYLVLGITMMTAGEPHGGGAHYQILNDYGAIRSIPSLLFEIEDVRCSRFWVAKSRENGALLLWPEEFFIEYFHDDLSEGIQETVEIFKAVVNRMSAEFE
jgi:hypothetical protein